MVVAAGAAGVQWAGGGITGLGLLLALGALACEAAFSLLAVPHLARLGPLAVSAYACLFAVPLLAVWSLIADGPSLPLPDAEQAAALAYLALGVTTFGFMSWYSAVGLLGVERAGLFSGVLPVSALLVSAALGVAEITPERLLAVARGGGRRDAGRALGGPRRPSRCRRPPNLSDVLLDALDWLGHSGFRIRAGKAHVYIDPYRVPEGSPPADLILITHGHYDHFSPQDVERLSTKRTWLVGPPAVAERVSGQVHSIAPGEAARGRAGARRARGRRGRLQHLQAQPRRQGLPPARGRVGGLRAQRLAASGSTTRATPT